jgi:hypothetical protein
LIENYKVKKDFDFSIEDLDSMPMID